MNGERVPEEVYADFRAAVQQILAPVSRNSAESGDASIPGDWPMAMPDPVKTTDRAAGVANAVPGVDRSSRFASPTLPGYRTSGLTVPPIIWVIGKLVVNIKKEKYLHGVTLPCFRNSSLIYI